MECNLLFKTDDLYTLPDSEACERTTYHGLLRTMERADLNTEQAYRMIRNAWERGTTADAAEQVRLREYIRCHCREIDSGMSQVRVYNGFTFIFTDEGILITMYQLPEHYKRRIIYDGKYRVRDPIKYRRMNAHKRQPKTDDYC